LEEEEIPFITKMIRDFKSIHNMTASNYEHADGCVLAWGGVARDKEDGRKAIVLHHHARRIRIPVHLNTGDR
jgi:hypothetical protein